ncbi:MAG TPA: glycosyltransferase family 1 protein [Acidimicrobiales bacterium]
MTPAGEGGAPVAVGVDVSAVPDEPRGAGRYVVELVRALDRRGNVDLRLETRRADAGRWRALSPGAEVFPVVPDGRARRLAWEQIASPRFVDRWGVDVFHGPHYTMPEIAKAPKVVTVHDLTFFDHPEWHEKVKVSLFTRAIRVAARRADALVCVSDATARRLHELLAPTMPVHVVPHGIDHATFRAEREADDEARLESVGVHPPYVAFLGTLEPRKDVATLVHAFDLIAPARPDVTLVVAGGRGWANERFERAVAESPYRDRIVRTGYLDEAVVPALLRNAAAVSYPALAEGFGLPALEALACGAPTITTEGSVMDEVTRGAAFGAPPGDPAGLAAVIDRVLSGGPDVAARRARGLDVAASYTWDATAEAHEAVYRDVAGAGGRRL